MAENHSNGSFPAKPRGRPPGSPNKITRDIRAALRDLAEGNSHRVQEWLDRVAETDPAEALRLFLGLLRYVTPTLQAAAIADLTPQKSNKELLSSMSDAELTARVIYSPEALAVLNQGITDPHEIAVRLAETHATSAQDDELLR